MVIKNYRDKQSWEVGGKRVSYQFCIAVKLEGLTDKMIYEQRPEGVREQAHIQVYNGETRGETNAKALWQE